jgi:transcriptional repressor NF-X1
VEKGRQKTAPCTREKLNKDGWVGSAVTMFAIGLSSSTLFSSRLLKFECKHRPFDCAIHFCSKQCHPPSPRPPPCPRSPSLVSHCPCGKQELSPSNTSSFPPNTLLSRTSCLDPIPTCFSTCMKSLETCSHVCSATCHVGPCPPCTIMLVRPCRCGATTKNVPCSSVVAGIQDDILCDRPCAVLRACGRHQCNRICCPLASLASATKGKGKKRVVGGGILDQAGIGEMGLHGCDLVCGKVLSCGNHQCEERDHRGICPPCLRSSFEEVNSLSSLFAFFLVLTAIHR